MEVGSGDDNITKCFPSNLSYLVLHFRTLEVVHETITVE